MRSTALPFYPAFLYTMYPGTHQKDAYLSITAGNDDDDDDDWC